MAMNQLPRLLIDMSQIKQPNNVLQSLGITQWRLRRPLAHAPVSIAVEKAPTIADESAFDQQVLKTPSFQSAIEPSAEPFGEELGVHQEQVTSQVDGPIEYNSREPSESKSVNTTNADLVSQQPMTKGPKSSEPASHEAVETAQLNDAPKQAGGPASSSSRNLQLDSQRKVDTHDVPTWSRLELDYEQRTHCGESGGLRSLPSATQRDAICAIIFSAPSVHDVEHQKAHSESSQRLLGEILRAVGIDQADTYQTNAIKCVGSALNEEPCAEWVHSELALLPARVCIVFGESAARAVLKTNSRMDVLRQAPRPHPFLPVQCVVTHSLEELLAKPELKHDSWQDLKAAAGLLLTR
jgi:uracil-DNA glycosylase family 4